MPLCDIRHSRENPHNTVSDTYHMRFDPLYPSQNLGLAKEKFRVPPTPRQPGIDTRRDPMPR